MASPREDRSERISLVDKELYGSYLAIPINAIAGSTHRPYSDLRPPLCVWIKLLCVTSFVAVGAILIAKFILIAFEYTRFVDAKCNTTSNRTRNLGPNDTYPYYIEGRLIQSGSYDHILLVASTTMVSLLNIVEYAQLWWGTHKYLRKYHRAHSKTTEGGKPTWTLQCKKTVIIFSVLIILVSFALAKCYFAVAMELEKLSCHTEGSLGGTVARVYIAYCVLELFNSGCGCVIRLAMLVQMFRIRHVWFGDKEDSERDNSSGITAYNVDELSDAAYSAVYDQYEERGRRVRIMLYPFSSWFWTPWIIFSFITLIKPHTLLTPWTYKREQSKVLLQARYFYMAYVIMKFVQLLTQNLCALQVNSYHKIYYCSMKKRLTTWYNTCRGDKQLYKTVACQKTFEFNEENNFSPTLFGVDPGLSLQTPLYILCLFFGVFITASDLLGKTFSHP